MKKNVILGILILLFASSACVLITQVNKNKEDEYVYDVLKKEVEIINNSDTKEEDKMFDLVKELQTKNSDIIGYIIIDGTNINYPLVQGSDNDFYLNHNYLKESNKIGSIFLSYKGNIKDASVNNIIYGHYTSSGSMFHDLHNYKSEDYYKEHSKITLYTENTKNTYEIISVFKSRVFYKDETDVFKYYNYINLNKELYDEYIENIKKIELYNTGKSAQYKEALLTLTTCEYSTKNGRMVVVAKQVDSYEKE